jgi:hypothetical protein
MTGNKPILALVALAVIVLAIGFFVGSDDEVETVPPVDAPVERGPATRRNTQGSGSVDGAQSQRSAPRMVDPTELSRDDLVKLAGEASGQGDGAAPSGPAREPSLAQQAGSLGSATAAGGWLALDSRTRNLGSEGILERATVFAKEHPDLSEEQAVSVAKATEDCLEVLGDIEARYAEGSIDEQLFSEEMQRNGLKCNATIREAAGDEVARELLEHMSRSDSSGDSSGGNQKRP